MTKYNYLEAVKEDVKNYIDSEINFTDFDSLEELEEKLNEFGQNNINVIEKGAEWADVTIRCYLLGIAISEVLDDLEEDFDEAHKEMEA